MNITNEQLRNIIQEELEAVLNEFEKKEMTPCEIAKAPEYRPQGLSRKKAVEKYCPDGELEEAAKKPCKPSKGKRFAKRVNGKCRSYGQKGQAKGGGDRIRPGTKKGDAYCAEPTLCQ
jgi:hypothetical protein